MMRKIHQEVERALNELRLDLWLAEALLPPLPTMSWGMEVEERLFRIIDQL